ncbi:PEP-CTERM sorting domain-containing protein [Derxia lacustris]|uniref:PEP-CTERM sorting domain-containing protein n=1 Tax=Derxia lacustris TaxID=764842 RepID=UPI000A16D872|nr:PEP-CTERM sorting domain-containing protein [Derxia lacustris]
MKFKLLAAALAATFAAGAHASTTVVFETELNGGATNDTFATAQDLGSLAVGNSYQVVGASYAPIAGQVIVPGNDSYDYYKFTLTGPSAVSLSLSLAASSGSPTFNLYSGSQSLLATAGSLTTLLSAGTYYTRVGGAGTGYFYSLSAAPATPAVPEPDLASLAVLALGAVGFVARRRKQA